MTRARVCTAASLLLGAMVISSFAFSQNMPGNWEVKYLNLKDNLRAMAVDPLDPKIVLIGSNLAVIGTTDGGETWIAGESFRIASFALTGVVSDEALEILAVMEEEAPEESPAAAAEEKFGPETAGPETAGPEDLDEARIDMEEQLGEGEQAAEEAAKNSADLEAELVLTRETGSAAQTSLEGAESAADAWEPDTLTGSEVDASSDSNQLAEWLEERELSVPAELGARQDELKRYLLEHEAEGVSLAAAPATAATESNAAAAQVAELEAQLAATEGKEEVVVEGVSVLGEEAATLEEKEGEVTESPEKKNAIVEEEREEETVDLQATGVNYLLFDPASSEKIYLAAFDGVYKSEDTGTSWKKIYTGPNPLQSVALCLAVDPSNPDAVFAGTLSGIAISRDGGKTWSRPPGRIADMVITRIAVHPFDSRIVLAGTVGDGAFKSTDGGNEWTQVLNRSAAGANRVLAIEFAPSQPEVIYAGTMSGIYKSLDGGESWDPATGMGVSPTVGVRDLVVSPVNPDLVVIAADQGVFGTVNGGGLWRKLAFGTIYNGAKLLSFDPLDPSTVWMITSRRVFRSAALGILDLSGGEEMTLSGGCEFTIDGREKHIITIEEIDGEIGEVTLTIQSEPRTVKIKVGESAAVDLTGDGRDDLNLALESLEDGVPRFKLVRIAPAVAAAGEELDALPRPGQINSLDDLEPYFRAEPTWVEVQQAASRWAEVHPDKIAAWRSGASLRALIPRVRLDFENRDRRREDYDQNEQLSYSLDYRESEDQDGTNNTQDNTQFQTAYTVGIYELYRKDNEIYSTDFGWAESYRIAESEKARYRDTRTDRTLNNKAWGVELRWDLGEFLFSSEQIRISTEARRLVELRQDVVEQVTLYYFDRRTARIDMILNPPADPFSRVEMLLRIQQINASLDAMTGGYFTQTIKDREKKLRR